MKKYFYVPLTVAAMMLASCSTEDMPVEVNDGRVTFTAMLPGTIDSRAFSDGTTATKLSYAVYSVADDNMLTHLELDGTATFTDLKANVSISLATGKTYTVAFWAQGEDAPYTFDATTGKVTVTATGNANEENRDAFFAAETFKVEGAVSKNVELTRPFAQINIGTNDIEAFTKSGGSISKSGINVKGYSTLDLISGEVEGEMVDYTLAPAALPTDETFPVNGYDYLTMNYILIGNDKEVVDVTWTSDNANATEVTFSQIPVQRNFRTNIYGALLTNPVDFNVIINPDYNDPDHNADPLIVAAANGGKVVLNSDVEIPVNGLAFKKSAIIDLNGHNITLADATKASFGLSADGAGVELVINGEGTIKAGNCVIPISSRNGAKVVINGGTFEGGINTSGQDNALECVYAVGEGAIVEINGGYFKTSASREKSKINNPNCPDTGWYYVLNKYNADNSNIIVKGGQFENYNPAWGDDALKQGGNFVADGYMSVEKTIDDKTVYEVISKEVSVTTAEDFKEAVALGRTINLTQPLSIDGITPVEGKPVAINLNGNNLTLTGNTNIKSGQELSIIGNGNETIDAESLFGFTTAGNAKLTLEGFTLNDKYAHNDNQVSTLVRILGGNNTVTIKDVNVIPNNLRCYAISTNAALVDGKVDSGDVVSLENVKVIPSVVVGCPVLFNTPITVNAKDCEFEGCNSAIILRGGTYEFENCKFTQTLAFDTEGNCTTTKKDLDTFTNSQLGNCYLYKNWGEGTAVPLAAVTMGNRSASYQYPTNVTMNGCTLSVPDVAKKISEDDTLFLPAVYAYANQGEGLGVTFNYENTTFDGEETYASTNIVVNGVSQNQ